MTNSKTKRIISVICPIWRKANLWEFTQTGEASGYGRKIGDKGNPVGVRWRIVQVKECGSGDIAWKTNGRITWQELKQY